MSTHRRKRPSRRPNTTVVATSRIGAFCAVAIQLLVADLINLNNMSPFLPAVAVFAAFVMNAPATSLFICHSHPQCRRLRRRVVCAERRKKKNKYASFSKADKLDQDPFERLVAESQTKVRELEMKEARSKNKQLPLDEEALRAQQQEKRVRNKREFPDTKTIDPYDPTTYGYIELGTIVGAHGVHGLVKVSAATAFADERLCIPGVRHLKAPNRRSPREVRLLEGRLRLDDEYLLKLEGIGDRDSASRLRGSVLYALQKERPNDIGADEYLVTDLVGLDVFLEEGYGDDNDDDLAVKNYSVEGAVQSSDVSSHDSAATGWRSDEPSVSERSGRSVGGSFVGSIGGILLAEDMCAVPGLGQDLLEVVLPRGRSGMVSWRDEMVLIPLVPEIVPRVDLQERAIYITPPRGLLDLTYVKEEKVRIRGFLPPAKD